ncbi:MAG: pentapeptide repeat-containing protein [Candidatus Levybacteria bacterium]|nr:pentapeptide repeat-containing protein [Candidatus Levybacteria bacterium]
MSKCNYCSKEHKDNTGCNNSGDYNSGDYNSGYRNSGDYNSGDYNSGYRNSGDYNSGDYNSGDYNSGYYNSGDYNSGLFNTNEPTMRFFNKDTTITYSEFVKGKMVYPDLKVCAWVELQDLPKGEQSESAKQMGGLLKTLSYKEAWKEYWGRASEEDKKWFQGLPNFTWEIFTEITDIQSQAEVSLSGKKVSVEIDGKKYSATLDELLL